MMKKFVKFFQLPIDIADIVEQKTQNLLAVYYQSVTQYCQGIYCVYKYR
jgi:hypothetical protein